jgi:F-type H+-transporting ATPase subunit b
MDKLGIEPFQLITQIFNFSVMVVVLTKLLYKPILKVLEERKKKIEEGLQYAEKMKEEAEKNEKARQEVINKAKEEARKIVEEGKKTGRKLEAEIVERAQKDAKAILTKGRKEIEIEKAIMEKDLQHQTIEISTSLVEAVLRNALDISNQKKIIDKKIQELAKHLK